MNKKLKEIKVTVAAYDAVGGPAKPTMGLDGNMMTPTKEGEFTINQCAQHVSVNRYRYYSGVKWGTPLREKNGKLEVYLTQGRKGDWFALEHYTPITKEEIVSEYWDLYKKEGLPDKWVFNDFGHMTCYYFKDLNKNGKLDGKEHKEGDMIHPTPRYEASKSQGKANVDIELDESHGCIHVRPDDIDDMIGKGYLKAGNALYVHPYSEKAPTDGIDIRGHFPFEVHFFPMARKIIVKGRVMVL